MRFLLLILPNVRILRLRGRIADAAILAGLSLAFAGAVDVSAEAANVTTEQRTAPLPFKAQVPFKAPVQFKAPVAPVPYDWTGFYVGGHAAFSVGRGTSTLSDPNPTGVGDSFSSLFGGVQGGYNYVLPSRLLLGAEADITFPNFEAYTNGVMFSGATPLGTTVTDQVDYIATLRGRFGYAFDHWLIYGTAGFAWAQATFGETPGLASAEDKILLTRTGWALGLGTEVAIARNWSARVEYLYDSFGSIAGVFPSGTGYQSAFDIQTLRVGLDYKLATPGGDTSTSASSDPWLLAPGSWNVHGQFTYVEQGYPAFHSPYEGANSLSGASQAKNTVSATGFVGYRPWDGTDIYINPEITQGFGLSETVGVAAFPNTEAQKAAFPMPRFDLARVYVQQTVGFGGEQETIEDGPNQIAGKEDISRLTLIAGKLAVTDFFDNNAYAHDGRTQFFNWQLYCCGAYDWTMDQVSYTWGAMAELNQKFWAFRAGYFLVPDVSNTDDFDTHFPDGEYIGELELRYSVFAEPGKLRLMAWANRADMGTYAAALAEPITIPTYPDITMTRTVRTNYGLNANLEQAITADLGLFARASWSPGQDEIIGWTDVDESVSAGVALKGTSWGRPSDTVGVAGVLDGLSAEARAYFAAGGIGILIGDGALNYQPEKILETYYSYSLTAWSTLSFDYQFVDNPAYNADRGPVHIIAGRLHAEF
ncbi:MAG: carbohydrate porin [Xanthobacteraceae bacterium]|jgi:high affinity Mn2+ porin